MAIVGILLVIILCFAAVFAPILTQYSPTKVTVSDAFLTPSLKHFAGTDDLGRDIFTRLLYGSRYSILLGVASTAGALIIGIFIGSISGYFGGQVDNIIMRILDVIQSMPSMLFAIIISAVLGAGFVQTIAIGFLKIRIATALEALFFFIFSVPLLLMLSSSFSFVLHIEINSWINKGIK